MRAATEESVLDLADHLPAEAAEALLELAVGGIPQPSLPVAAGGDPFSHPDAMRRFRIMNNIEELAAALEYPWERCTVFLHPDQQGIVERNHNGPARVSGSAGTGKTVVALHRAAHLARTNPGAHVLLTTFSDALAHQLQAKLKVLTGSEPDAADRIEVRSLDALALAYGTRVEDAQDRRIAPGNLRRPPKTLASNHRDPRSRPARTVSVIRHGIVWLRRLLLKGRLWSRVWLLPEPWPEPKPNLEVTHHAPS